MINRTSYARTAVSTVILAILSACATPQPPVVERFDERTAVTITNSRTPIIMSPDTPYEGRVPRDYLQIGAIEVNRMGTLQYFLWLGISNLKYMTSEDMSPKAFESIVLVAGGKNIRLDVLGWTPEAIGASMPVYNKLFRNSSDAYYPVTLDHIQLLLAAEDLKLQIDGADSTEYVPWYKQATAKSDLTEFLRAVRQ